MKQSRKDQIEGKFHELKGGTKEAAGRAVNNPDLTARGRDEKISGVAQKKAGQVERAFEK